MQAIEQDVKFLAAVDAQRELERIKFEIDSKRCAGARVRRDIAFGGLQREAESAAIEHSSATEQLDKGVRRDREDLVQVLARASWGDCRGTARVASAGTRRSRSHATCSDHDRGADAVLHHRRQIGACTRAAQRSANPEERREHRPRSWISRPSGRASRRRGTWPRGVQRLGSDSPRASIACLNFRRAWSACTAAATQRRCSLTKTASWSANTTPAGFSRFGSQSDGRPDASAFTVTIACRVLGVDGVVLLVGISAASLAHYKNGNRTLPPADFSRCGLPCARRRGSSPRADPMHTHSFAAQVERALGIAAKELVAAGNPGAAFAQAIVRAIPASQHFTLPAGGRLFDDGLRGLDTDLHAIRLPFPVITLSFADGDRRTLVVAQNARGGTEHHRGESRDGHGRRAGRWGFFPCTAQPEQRHDDGSIGWQCFDSIGSRLDRTPMHEAVMAAGRSVLELVEALS